MNPNIAEGSVTPEDFANQPPEGDCSQASCSLLFRSEKGEWKKSALDDGGNGQELQPIVAACCETCGDAIGRHANENGLHWVRRVADWWQDHKANE